MEVEPRVPTKPRLHLLTLVDAQVVEHHMDLELGGDPPVEDVHEREELLLRVLRIESGHDLPVEDVEGREQVDRAVPSVVMGTALGPVLAHREDGLGSLECLGLRLLVDAEDDGLLRWILVESDDIDDLLLEPPIVAKLERLLQVRLEAVTPPDAMHGDRVHPDLLRHPSRRPMGTASRLAVQGPVDDAGDDRARESGSAPRARGVLHNPFETQQEEAATPEPDGVGSGREFFRDLLVLLPLGRPKDDASAKNQPQRCRAASRPGLELGAFARSKFHRRGNTHATPMVEEGLILSPNSVALH